MWLKYNITELCYFVTLYFVININGKIVRDFMFPKMSKNLPDLWLI